MSERLLTSTLHNTQEIIQRPAALEHLPETNKMQNI